MKMSYRTRTVQRHEEHVRCGLGSVRADPRVRHRGGLRYGLGRDASRRPGHPTVLVTDRKGEYHGRPLFDSYRNGRHATPRSPRVAVRPGAVVAHVPTPEALALASRLAAGNALVVVEHPAPWRLAGWAGAVGAHDLVTGQVASLDPRLSERLEELVWFGNNGYARGYGRDNAQRVLNPMRADGLLDRDGRHRARRVRHLTAGARDHREADGPDVGGHRRQPQRYQLHVAGVRHVLAGSAGRFPARPNKRMFELTMTFIERDSRN
jgi:hypothetical protein